MKADSHSMMMKRMSSIIEYIFIGFKPFGLKYVFICYINYSRKFFKVFISTTSGIRAHKTHTRSWKDPAKEYANGAKQC